MTDPAAASTAADDGDADLAEPPPADGEADAPIPPADAEGWRRLLLALPARELLGLVRNDTTRAARLLSGFRAVPESVRHPIVLSRLVEEAQKQRDFADAVLGRAPAEPPSTSTPAPPPVAPPPPRVSPPHVADLRLKEKLKEQRSLLRQKDQTIADLEGAAAELRRQRDEALSAAEQARAEKASALAEAARERRQRQRDARRDASAARPREMSTDPAPGPATAPPAASPVAPPAVGPAAPPVPWEEALRRIISRGKPDVAAEVCREALQAAASGNPDDPGGGAGSSGSLAPVHALYAEALYAQGGNGERAAEHDRRAATGFLDAARIDRAAMLFARSLTETDARAAAALQKDALLRRLLQMARQRGEEAAVRRAFERLRGSGRPETYERLSRALSSLGKDYAEAFAPAPPEIPPVGPDELISLPAAGLAEITPRRLTAAVDAGDEAVVAAARQAIERLQARDAALAGALLSAVAALDPAARFPLADAAARRGPIIVDASNVARHDPDPLALTAAAAAPRARRLIEMRDFLLERGFFPVLLVADANLRFHVDDRGAYRELVERGVVRETLPGTVADKAMIDEARERHAPLVTNDRLADWDEATEIERIPFGIFAGRISLTSF